MHPPAALRRTLTVTIIPVTFASGAAAPGFDDGEKVDVRVEKRDVTAVAAMEVEV